MKIIINADDFGIDYDRDIGILYGVLKGYITSVSVIVTNKVSFFRKILICIIRRKASVGLHINLTDDPLTIYKADELYKKKYNYKKPKFIFWKNALEDNIYIDKIGKEIENQFLKFVNIYGFIPEHLDGHNHCNIFNSKINALFRKISCNYKIHLRIPYEKITINNIKRLNDISFNIDIKKQNLKFKFIIDNFEYFMINDVLLYDFVCEYFNYYDEITFIGSKYGYKRDPYTLYNQITDNKDKSIIQIMCHPGFYLHFLSHNTKFSNLERYDELKALKKVKKMLLKCNNVILSNYRDWNNDNIY